jgi:ABC-type oligopeptide transport system substrate-binding subunit
MQTENTYVYDLESYPNCFIAIFKKLKVNCDGEFKIFTLENILELKTFLNQEQLTLIGYNNFKFDSIYGLAERTKNHKKRMILHNLLDQILVQESAVVPIFSEDLFVIVNIRVRDFNISNSGIIDFSRIFIKEVT